MTFLGVEGVSKLYGSVAALDGVDLAVPVGSRTAVVGPSGSGKTTLLRLIAGFELPAAGRITLGGDVLADGPAGVPAHRRGIGFVSQDGALFPHLSVADNIGFGLGRRTPGRQERIAGLMDSVELDRSMRDRRPHQLSGGQQQRVALARALARQPKLMLFDEPFSALDTGLRDNMRKMVAKILAADGVTAILVTHDQAEALSFADRIAVLDRGRLLQVGSPSEIYLNPRDQLTATFLGDAIVLPAELGDGFAECALGHIPAETGGRRGSAGIMLRPEQLRLAAVSSDLPAGYADPAGCHGRVTDVLFGGAVSTVVVSLEDSPARTSLRVKSFGADLPPVGGRVRVTVLGRAHVLDESGFS